MTIQVKHAVRTCSLTEEGTQDETGSGNAKILNDSIDRHLSVIAGAT
jgi:hypothetical protein